MGVNTTAAGRELGAALQKVRNDAQLSLRALAEKLGFSDTKISLWEKGHRLISLEDLDATMEVLEVSADGRERLRGLRRQAEPEPGTLVADEPTTIGAQLSRLIEQERTARRITEAASLLIPGLLQTEDYARAILDAHPDVEQRLTVRMGRKSVITRERNPVELHAIIDSEALVRPVAPREVMAGQLKHLLVMGERPNITIQVLPSTARGYTPMLAGAFILLEFPMASPVVHLEHHRASTTIWAEEDVAAFIAAADKITKTAMTPERTSEVIAELVHGMETETT